MKRANEPRNFFEIILNTLKRIRTEKPDPFAAKAEAAKIMLRQSGGSAKRAVDFFTTDELVAIFDIVRILVDKNCHDGAIIAMGNDINLNAPEFYPGDSALSSETKARINAATKEELFYLNATVSECST